ncbi:glycoside hydrolase family 43 protein [Microbacterium phyllosphaerae]|uniref:glycoside hydrolase family 43 protein n=1 Tax=Microbacterium phyllosphaerae TaxID=124798 RepID=UPI000EA26637|nr:glycoside hydrolase family 43 protein [Microbacterium phyllosphaerae]
MHRAPVVPGFHPDPSICRVGDTYWMVCSTFEYAPGVPLFRSTDLRAWEKVGHVLADPAHHDVTAAGPSGGISAPTLRHHGGQFWMITTNHVDGQGMLLTRAEDPLGTWTTPVRIPGLPGLDPDLAWDSDGTLLITYPAFGAEGPLGIVQQAVDPLTGRILTDMRPVWQGTGGKFPEGPHLYEVDGLWYLLIAEGGTERGHAVTIARGPSPAGPFEPCPWNPLLTHRGTDLPVQSTGHADLIQREDGSWAIVFHGVRPRGGSPEWHVLGRETFAAEIEWVDGWPRLGEWLTPAVSSASVAELDDEVLPASWISPRVFPGELLKRKSDGWSLTALDADPASENIAFVGRRQEHLFASSRVTVDAARGVGGLSVRLEALHHFDLEVRDGAVRAIAQIGPARTTLGEARPGVDLVDLEIRLVRAEGDYTSSRRGPDIIVGGLIAEDGSFQELGRLDGRYVSTEVAGGMTGRLIGVWCSEGVLGVSDFYYVGADDPDRLPAWPS